VDTAAKTAAHDSPLCAVRGTGGLSGGLRASRKKRGRRHRLWRGRRRGEPARFTPCLGKALWGGQSCDGGAAWELERRARKI
jgi:hypothetical protein